MNSGSLTLKEGERFKKGQLIYVIDDREARLNLQSQVSNFLRDIASILPDLKMDYSSSYDEWNSFFAEIEMDKPLPELPKHKSAKEKTFLATKNIYSSYYSLKSAEVNLRKYRFYAPFNGVISKIDLQSGSYVNPGNKIGTILRSDRMELKADVSVQDIDWVEHGAKADVYTESGLTFNGQISRIGEFVNQNTQSIDVYISIKPEAGKKLYDGEYLKTKIPGRLVKGGMEIPRNAVFDDNKVFVLKDSLLKVMEINVHKLNPESIVFSGIEEGSDLVVEPLINAHNNMKAYKLEEKEDINIEEKESSAKLVKS